MKIRKIRIREDQVVAERGGFHCITILSRPAQRFHYLFHCCGACVHDLPDVVVNPVLRLLSAVMSVVFNQYPNETQQSNK